MSRRWGRRAAAADNAAELAALRAQVAELDTALTAQVAELDTALREVLSLLRLPVDVPARRADPARRRPADYAVLVSRLHSAVTELVPPGSGVLVVSRGDDDLLALDGRPAGHFPQADGGGYAGYHPKDSDSAVAELERLRAQGWRYLVFPATALWWLDHYAGLRRHLETTDRLLLRQDGVGLVYGLTPLPATEHIS